MDLLFMIKERYMFLSVFLIIICVSLFLLLAIWKNHFKIPKILTMLTVIICTFIIVLSILGMIFAVTFGYNF